MPAKAYRATVMFSLGTQGWREVYYWYSEAGSSSAFLDDVKVFVELRRRLLAFNATLMGVSFTELQVLESKVVGTTTFNDREAGLLTEEVDVGAGVVGAESPAKPYQSALVTCTGQDGGPRRKIQLRGLPEIWWGYLHTAPLAPPVPTDLGKKFEPFRQFLMNKKPTGFPQPVGEWQIRARTRNTFLTRPIQIDQITTVTPTNKTWRFLLGEVPDYTIGQKVLVRVPRQDGLRGLSGINTIRRGEALQWDLIAKKTDTCSIQYEGGGTVSNLVYILTTIAEVELTRFGVRDTGSPSLQPRGRSRSANKEKR